MPIPQTPFPGMVVRYAFLWRHEAEQGRTEALKDRPCVVVVAIRRAQDDRFRVRVLPITHSMPDQGRGVAIPPKVKRHLGLDQEASWIILDEANEFVWPGVDLRPVSRTKPGVWTFGVLPEELFEEIRDRLAAVLAERRLAAVSRTE